MNAAASQDTPLVGIIMGSQSDWATLEHTANMLKQLGVPFEAEVVSAHRTPDRLFEYANKHVIVVFKSLLQVQVAQRIYLVCVRQKLIYLYLVYQ